MFSKDLLSRSIPVESVRGSAHMSPMAGNNDKIKSWMFHFSGHEQTNMLDKESFPRTGSTSDTSRSKKRPAVLSNIVSPPGTHTCFKSQKPNQNNKNTYAQQGLAAIW